MDVVFLKILKWDGIVTFFFSNQDLTMTSDIWISDFQPKTEKMSIRF